MAVISIKKYLSLDTEAAQTLMNVVRILIQGIGKHAVGEDADECAQFRAALKEASDALMGGISPTELVGRAGSVLNALEVHNQRFIRRQRLQTAELQKMVKMLASTVGAVSSAGNATVARLCEIEAHVAKVSELHDVRDMKTKLSDCLADIRKEADHQRAEAGETVKQLSQGLDQARKCSAGANEGEALDPVTGLPLRHEAEAALAELSKTGSDAYAAIMVLDRFEGLNLRFGREAGDEILNVFTQTVREHLTAEDRLFRWGAPAFLALLRRPGGLECVRSEVGHILETLSEHTIQTASRKIRVPIAPRWALFPAVGAASLLFEKIDAFAGILGSRA